MPSRRFRAFLFSLAIVLLGYAIRATAPASVPDQPPVHASEKPAIRLEDRTVSVLKVVDGDTIEVKGEDGTAEKVRLLGINTPETVDPRRPVQCFGKEASARTKELLKGGEVVLASDPTQDDRDKYGRLLRYVALPDGTDVDLALVLDGYAHEYTYRVPYERQAAYRAAESAARAARKGLWDPAVCPGS